jgi:hypothetical protein
VLGGTTGLGGILPTVWCNLRAWPKDEQRAVFQTVAVAIFAVTVIWLGGTGAVSQDDPLSRAARAVLRPCVRTDVEVEDEVLAVGLIEADLGLLNLTARA